MEKLIFVYNAKSGVVNTWMDIGHKILKPSSYECDLCALTYGSFREKRIWKNFKKEFEHPLEFYHKDEFLQKFESKWLPTYDFPIILISDGTIMEPLISSKEFLEINSTEELITFIKALTQQDFD